MNITPLEQKRLQNINFIMDDIHDSVNQHIRNIGRPRVCDETRRGLY